MCLLGLGSSLSSSSSSNVIIAPNEDTNDRNNSLICISRVLFDIQYIYIFNMYTKCAAPFYLPPGPLLTLTLYLSIVTSSYQRSSRNIIIFSGDRWQRTIWSRIAAIEYCCLRMYSDLTWLTIVFGTTHRRINIV